MQQKYFKIIHCIIFVGKEAHHVKNDIRTIPCELWSFHCKQTVETPERTEREI